ncbi:hypothetical protein SO802_015853 [Lithocarpus litseifolius]|uniref:Uncharacterized protein n=1 Tax=Lithocarpus litseifolius TaxID=425828 RepID=A0AAW2CX45_9ROSI
MANPRAKQLLAVLFAITFMVLIVSSQARMLTQKGIDDHDFQRISGYDRSKLIYYQKVSRMNKDPERVAPGGPDSQHHNLPPESL